LEFLGKAVMALRALQDRLAAVDQVEKTAPFMVTIPALVLVGVVVTSGVVAAKAIRQAATAPKRKAAVDAFALSGPVQLAHFHRLTLAHLNFLEINHAGKN
jgi:hypothetical protein